MLKKNNKIVFKIYSLNAVIKYSIRLSIITCCACACVCTRAHAGARASKAETFCKHDIHDSHDSESRLWIITLYRLDEINIRTSVNQCADNPQIDATIQWCIRDRAKKMTRSLRIISTHNTVSRNKISGYIQYNIHCALFHFSLLPTSLTRSDWH